MSYTAVKKSMQYISLQQEGVAASFSPKHLGLKRGDSVARIICWKDKQEVYVPSNMHIAPVEHNYKDCRKAVKPLITEEYSTHMGYSDLIVRMVNNCSLASKPGKGLKLFIHFLDLTILSACILY
jgi:hypothetical protein